MGRILIRGVFLLFAVVVGCGPSISDEERSSDSASASPQSTSNVAADPAPPNESVNETVGALSVTVEGIAEASGSVHFALFDDPVRFEDRSQPVRSAQLTPEGSTCRWEVADLPEGEYALAVFHDLDGDHQLTKSILGLPREPYAFSNQPRTRFRPPSFAEACFQLKGTVEMTVEFRTLKRED
jgi:uncharacterized protein (DUF2141 family)